MRMYVVTSGGKPRKKDKPQYCLHFDDIFAQRFLMHLRDNPELCTGCGEACVSCRGVYELDFSSKIAGVLKLPSDLLYYIDQPNDHLPSTLPQHDVMVAIGIHEDVLLALPELAKKGKAEALIVPVEDPDWLTRWVKEELKKICKELNLECAFPKPFCSLEKGEHHPTINKFIDRFRLGHPKLEIKIVDEKIKQAKVLRSAPCGNTYFVAHNLKGVKADEQLDLWVAKYWHSFPCVASMKMDYELGDTILHKGGYNHYDAVHEAVKLASS